MAAEISGSGTPRRPEPGFNEAAANGRGNDRIVPPHFHERVASMRPRRMAAEMRPPRSMPPFEGGPLQ